MAPKGMKRPASAAAAKKGKKPAVDPEIKAKRVAVEEALSAYEAMPEAARQVLVNGVQNTLHILKDDRHPMQAKMVEMVASALADIEASYNTGIETLTAKVEGADAEKAALAQSETDATTELDTLKATTSEASTAAEAASTLLKEAKAALEKATADQKTGDAAYTKSEEDKAKLDSKLTSVIIPCKEASAGTVFAKEEKKQLKDFGKVCKEFTFDTSLIDTGMVALSKAPDSRGTFEKFVMKQLEEGFSKKIAALASDLEVHAPGKAERAEVVTTKESELAAAEAKSKEAQEVLTTAQGKEAEGTKLLAEKAKAVKHFEPEMKKVESSLKKAKAALEGFKTGALKGFEELKDLAPPPPPPEPEPVPEEAAPAEPAPMEEEPAAPAESAEVAPPTEASPAEA